MSAAPMVAETNVGASFWKTPGLTAFLLLAAVNAFFCLAYLDQSALWFDEAETAHYGRSVEVNGYPDCLVGEYLYYYKEHGNYKDYALEPWGQFYLEALSFKLLGESTITARLPFALGAALLPFALGFVSRRWIRSLWPAAFVLLLLIFDYQWFHQARQTRGHIWTPLLALIFFHLYFERQRWGAHILFFLIALFIAWLNFATAYALFVPVMFLAFLYERDKRRWTRTLVIFPFFIALCLLPILIAKPYKCAYIEGFRADPHNAYLYQALGLLRLLNKYIFPIALWPLLLLPLIPAIRRCLNDTRFQQLAVYLVLYYFTLAIYYPLCDAIYVRYFLAGIPLTFLLLSWMAIRINRWVGGIVLALLLLSVTTTLPALPGEALLKRIDAKVKMPERDLDVHYYPPMESWKDCIATQLYGRIKHLTDYQLTPETVLTRYLELHPQGDVTADVRFFQSMPVMFHNRIPLSHNIEASHYPERHYPERIAKPTLPLLVIHFVDPKNPVCPTVDGLENPPPAKLIALLRPEHDADKDIFVPRDRLTEADLLYDPIRDANKKTVLAIFRIDPAGK